MGLSSYGYREVIDTTKTFVHVSFDILYPIYNDLNIAKDINCLNTYARWLYIIPCISLLIQGSTRCDKNN